MKISLVIVLLLQLLYAREIVIIADKNFPKTYLNKKEIKAFFLDKVHFVNGKRVLVMNRKYGEPVRMCFEKLILHKNKSALERYWQKAYYQGKKPPKIVESTQMLFAYLKNITPSIGYADNVELLSHKVKILYRAECL